ncbi:MAG TPA: choice-of-anchor J domain-containing protein [Steroidobacteraceae bacterium]|jgi:hypothetical protein|nr:choice-of-anchor J domain-containing protein [Steroidobacteraceae bacterium]
MLFCSLLIAASATANAGVIFEEGFDNINTLGAAGWLAANIGTPGGTGDTWFQGNSDIFAAQSGAADSYIASSYLSAGVGQLDNWLVTPLIYAVSGTVITFATRTAGNVIEGNPDTGDNLQVLVNNRGTNLLADFVSLGFLSSASYPVDWQSFYTTYVGESTDIRFAFRYTVADTGVTGDYIGIDSVSVNVPEPGTMLLLGAGLLLVPVAMRRRRRERA